MEIAPAPPAAPLRAAGAGNLSWPVVNCVAQVAEPRERGVPPLDLIDAAGRCRLVQDCLHAPGHLYRMADYSDWRP